MVPDRLFASCRFGLESVVASELKRLRIDVEKTLDARVFFRGGASEIARANMFLRTADRVFMEAGSFCAKTFDELYEGTKALPWADFIARDTKIHVKGKQARSWLHSVSDAQSIVKKAIVDKLSERYKLTVFPETGKTVIIEVGMLGDTATLALDASGAGLSRRGYHTLNVQAPLAETLAAALVLLSRWDMRTPLYDPFCGSGTIPIEAQMIAMDRAPGLNRSFAAMEWHFLDQGVFARAKEEALDRHKNKNPARVFGSDIDPDAVKIARQHAKQAEVPVTLQRMDFGNFHPAEASLVVCNPPYGERLGTRGDAEALFRRMGSVFRSAPLESANILCAHPNFERAYGQRAQKRRNLYNAGIKCQLFRFE